MGAKLFDKKVELLKFTWDVPTDGGAVGVVDLGDLPSGFVCIGGWYEVETALVGGGSCTLGEDGASGDVDGYMTDMDALSGVGQLIGAKLYDSTDKEFIPHKVDADEDGVQVTVATTPYTAGKVHFYFQGFQSLV